MCNFMIFKNINFEKEKVYTVREIIETVKDYYRKKKRNKGRQLVLDFVDEQAIEMDVELPAYANTLIGKLKKFQILNFPIIQRKNGNLRKVQFLIWERITSLNRNAY